VNRISTIAIAAALMTGACAQTMDSQNADESMDSGMEQRADATAAAPNDAPVGGTAPQGTEPATSGSASSGTIVDAASSNADLSTLASAVTAAGLQTTLSQPGPFTVFSPTNAAFDKLLPGLLSTLQQPANKGRLTSVLAYHVVPGRVTAADLMRQIDAGGGRATLRTAQGGTLTATKNGDGVVVSDSKGNAAKVTNADIAQSNGVVHVVDAVLIPG
jgi:uncharacterized surface protein with fasciclin (FAS1) repeats